MFTISGMLVAASRHTVHEVQALKHVSTNEELKLSHTACEMKLSGNGTKHSTQMHASLKCALTARESYSTTMWIKPAIPQTVALCATTPIHSSVPNDNNYMNDVNAMGFI